MPRTIAIYPGTFDPITRGHEDLIGRACTLFDELIVAVAAGHHKKPLFSLEERLNLVQCSITAGGWRNVRAAGYDGLVRDFVRSQSARVMVRGVRAVSDFDYEVQLAGMNRALMPDVETVFLSPSDMWRHVSSTYVREIAKLGQPDEVAPFVSPHVAAALKRALRS